MGKRQKRISFFALNVTMHPHSAEGYLKLFQRARTLKVAGLMSGNRYCTIASIAPKPDEAGLHHGRLNTFVDFNLKAPWLDTETEDYAEQEKLAAIQLPATLKPEYRPVDFALDPKKHHVFIYKAFGPHPVRRGMAGIFNSERVNRTDSPINVTVVQDEAGLNAIWSIAHLTRLQIVIRRPNPDDFEEFDARLQERLAEQQAERVEIELVGTRKAGLKPDASTRMVAESALENGSVSARGYAANGSKTSKSTESIPRVFEELYDPKKVDEITAFRRAIRNWPFR